MPPQNGIATDEARVPESQIEQKTEAAQVVEEQADSIPTPPAAPVPATKVEKPDAVKAEKANVPLVGKGLIGRKGGEAFATMRSAKSARTRQGLTDTAEIIEVPGGFAIRPPANVGKAMVNEAKSEIEQTATATVLKNDDPIIDTPELVITDEQLKTTIDPEVYNAVMLLSEKMAKDPRPERFSPYIQKNFGSVRAFMSLRNAIMNDEVVPGDTTQVTSSPVGEVENVEVTNPEPTVSARPSIVESAVNQEEDTAATLSELDNKIANLERVMASSANPDKLMNRLDALMEQRDRVRNKLGVDTEERQKAEAFTKEEIDELVKLDEDTHEFANDDDFMFHKDGRRKGPAVREAEISIGQRTVQKFKDSIKSEFKDQIEIYYVNKEGDIPEKYQNLRNAYKARYTDSGRGVIFTPTTTSGDPQVVLIFGRPGLTAAQYEWTLFHEIVGHFGVQKLFGGEFNRFLDLALKNKDLASRALSMRSRWPNIDLSVTDKDSMTIDDTYDYMSSVISHPHKYRRKEDPQMMVVSRKGMRLLMDEYIAELAGQVSQGDFTSLPKQEQGFVRRIVAWMRHLLRKSGFGHIAPKIGDGEILTVLKASYENLTRDPVFTKNNKFTPVAAMAQEMTEEVITEGSTAGLFTEAQARGLIKSIDSRQGRIDNSKWQMRIESISDSIRRSFIGKGLSSVGHLPHPSKLAAVENLAKGSMDKATKDANKWFMKTRNMSDQAKKLIFNYFTTKDADPNQLPKEIRGMAVDMKQQIDDLGQELVRLGALNPKTYEKNSGQYLPLRYWKYLDGYYRSGGKKLSFREYLKKRGDLTDAEKQALGRIEDPSFLVAETVGTLGRDVALFSMFKNMQKLDQVGHLGWFLGTPRYIDVAGKKMSIDDIESNIERLEMQLKIGEGVSPFFLNERGIAEIERQLQELTTARDNAIESARTEDALRAIEAAGIQRDDITPDMIVQYQKNFRKIKDPAYGPLMNKWVRKEIYDEIVESAQMFDKNHTDAFNKVFGAGGIAERGNIYWKQFKVTANPPSWFRNGIGNLILLDIGSDRNIGTLTKWLGEEVTNVVTKKQSRWVQWANEYGLYNTTYSAAELNTIQDEAWKKYKSNQVKLDKQAGLMKSMSTRSLFTLQRWGMEYLDWSRNFYGGMEGLFKTVALRDHVQRWEELNGRKIDQVDQATRDAVLREAAATANKNIFDYSKVPGWMRTMRRMPFVGAPFLTYTFKAIPQSVESLARRPHKFIKYAMFPYVLQQMFMLNNDMDDDDVDEIRRMFPQWMKEKSSVFLLPWKDSNGKWQAMEFGYYLPWAPLHEMALMAHGTFDVNNPLMSTGAAALNGVTNLGFLGGPLPTMISGILTNKDPFMGTEIVRTTGTANDKANDFFRYMGDLWMPTFLTSKGVLGRMMDNMGIEATPWNSGREFSSTGQDRETGGQAALRGVGVNVRAVDPRENRAAKVRTFRFERNKIEMAKRKIAKDPNMNPQTRIAKMRELNEQIKLLTKKHREELQGVR